MSKPKVQIVIPVYNSAKYSRRCLDSLLEQTYPYWEAIMVNDASKDNSAEIMKEYQTKDDRITVYNFEENHGVSKVRNFAMEKLSEKYTAFLDSDDFWEKDMLEVMVEKAESENVDVVQCRYFYDYLGGRQVLPKGVFKKDTAIDKNHINKIYYKMSTGINMNHVCMKLIRTEFIKDIRFDPTLKTAEDLKFSTKLFCKVRSYYFHKYLNFYRITLAMHLLEYNNYSIGEIGQQVGIPVAKTFSRLFRTYTAMSPKEYRRKINIVADED